MKSTHASSSIVPPVVLLVDSKKRDLDVAILIAHHLNALGVECHLEPLESYRAVLAAYRPGLILFNHLTASHLVAYSKRLAKIGVLTAVLPNEGIMYDPEDLKYSSGQHHSAAHIDYFFCWNEAHRQALLAQTFNRPTHVEVIGVPRFDFYFEPYKRLFKYDKTPRKTRPRLLVCTNFVTAMFWELPRTEGDKFFAPWKDRITIYKNYWKSIEAHWKGRKRFFDFLDTLIAADKFDITLRPHPREDVKFYANWLDQLPARQRDHITLDSGSNISALILECDLEISCETCTTALESWIARKPTVELIFEKDILWHQQEQAPSNIPCENPDELPALVERELANRLQPEKNELRRNHLAKWCDSPDGTSCQRLASILANAVRNKPPSDWSLLDAADRRRALKLKFLHSLGMAYHYNPFLPLKAGLFPKKYAIKEFSYEKSIKPRDVHEARLRLEKALNLSATKN